MLDAEVAARIRRRLADDGPAGLSDVEGTVLALIVEGSTNPEIVERTGLGADALHETVTSLLAKLGLDRATGLTDLGRALISA